MFAEVRKREAFVQSELPVGLLTGITPLSEAPQAWLVQILWIIGMWIISTLFFRVAIRKITVQGG